MHNTLQLTTSPVAFCVSNDMRNLPSAFINISIFTVNQESFKNYNYSNNDSETKIKCYRNVINIGNDVYLTYNFTSVNWTIQDREMWNLAKEI